MNHGVAELVNLAYSQGVGSAVRAHMTAVIQNRPAPAAAPLEQRVSHDGPDRHLPITGRRHVRRLVRSLVRCYVSQPGKANQALVKAGSPNTSLNEGSEPKTLTENRKRAAGIEPASSAWKAEVLPLNYARWRQLNLAGSFWHGTPGRECLAVNRNPGAAKPLQGSTAP